MAGQANVRGGERAREYLFRLAQKLGTGGVVRVGFFEHSTYPSRRLVMRKGKRVRAKRARAQRLYVAQVAFWNNFGTSRAPARPFFTNTIQQQAPTWGRKIAAAARHTNYDTHAVLTLLGQDMAQQIVKAIVEWPKDNAKSTADAKGFNKGLIDEGIMQRNVGYEVQRA